MRKLLILSLLLFPIALRAETPKLPSNKEQKALVFDSLFAFNKAVQQKSFAQFHEERLSTQFKKKFSLAEFTARFQVFLDKNYDISNIAKSEPVFDTSPAIDSKGYLALKGHYPTRPNKVTFELTYEYESSAWKILGLNVQVVPVVENTGKVPAVKEIKTLALDSLLLFNVALQTKSFENFYNKSAKVWQKETTPRNLLQAFQSFIDQGVNIASIVKAQPDFDGSPAINEDGFLAVKGSYPTQPNKVFFELKYAYENDSWKLVEINVQVKPTSQQPTEENEEENTPDDKPDDADEN